MSTPKHKGVYHWIAQRLSAAVLAPLSLWFVASFVMLLSAPYEHVQHWILSPWRATLTMLFLGLSFYHGALGMQVIWEDYVAHPKPFIYLTNGISIVFTLLSLLAIVKVYIG